MRVLLISLDLKNITPLALGYIKTYAMEDKFIFQNFKIDIKNFHALEKINKVSSYIKSHRPALVGFSCFVWNIEKILSISKAVKQSLPHIKITLGGPEVSPRGKRLLEQNPHIDIVVTAEGEITFKKILFYYSKGSPELKDIAGIAFRVKNRVVSNVKSAQILRLDSIPSPYTQKVLIPDKRSIATLETMRGCAFKCDYCFYHKDFPGVRYFSLNRVKKDLRLLLGSSAREIYFLDPTFNINRKRLLKICRFIATNNEQKKKFHAELRAELVDKKVADSLKAANFTSLEVGLQSFNKKALVSINRPLDLSRFRKGFELLNGRIKNVELQLIIGLPNDTYEGFIDSLRHLIVLNPKNFKIFTLMLLPGTKLLSRYKKNDLKFSKKPPYNVYSTETLPAKKLKECQMLANILIIFFSAYQKTSFFLSKELGIDFIHMLKLFLGWSKKKKDLLDLKYILTTGLSRDFLKFIKFLCRNNNIAYDFYRKLSDKEKLSLNQRRLRIISNNLW